MMAEAFNSSCAGLTRASILFAKSFYEEGWIAGSSPAMTARAVVPAKAGTHDHRRWLWVPALAALGRDDESLERSTNLRLYKMAAGGISLFPIDVNNGNCNSNVFGLRGPYHPHMSPHDVAPSVVNPTCNHPSSPDASPPPS